MAIPFNCPALRHSHGQTYNYGWSVSTYSTKCGRYEVKDSTYKRSLFHVALGPAISRYVFFPEASAITFFITPVFNRQFDLRHLQQPL